MSVDMAVFASCVVLLFVKMFALSCYQGYARIRFAAFTNPEDAAVFKRAAMANELPPVERGARAWRNDLENIPTFFALGGLAIALDSPAITSAWLCGVFTAARVMHSLTYLAGVQPWRTLSYGVGVLCLMGLAVRVMARVLSML
jgi:uncharacterized MAPEG superfamily protein